jgi:hypothetical protein
MEAAACQVGNVHRESASDLTAVVRKGNHPDAFSAIIMVSAIRVVLTTTDPTGNVSLVQVVKLVHQSRNHFLLALEKSMGPLVQATVNVILVCVVATTAATPKADQLGVQIVQRTEIVHHATQIITYLQINVTNAQTVRVVRREHQHVQHKMAVHVHLTLTVVLVCVVATTAATPKADQLGVQIVQRTEIVHHATQIISYHQTNVALVQVGRQVPLGLLNVWGKVMVLHAHQATNAKVECAVEINVVGQTDSQKAAPIVQVMETACGAVLGTFIQVESHVHFVLRADIQIKPLL